MKKLLSVTGFILFLLVGLGLLLYPYISSWLEERNHAKIIQEYDVTIADITAQDMEIERQKAREYNDFLTGAAIKDPFVPGSGIALPDNYTGVLNFKGTIGYIDIPKIGVNLPIYHGTSEAVLDKGVGHLENTAFPIGGEGNHAVLTGHRGLSSAKLFTNLDKLVIGDIFYIRVLDETLSYQVDQVLVVEPSITENLLPIRDKDYVTLITCTPYAVNTHRLLVRGVRVPYTADKTEQTMSNSEDVNGVIAIILAILAIITYCLIRYWNKRNR